MHKLSNQHVMYEHRKLTFILIDLPGYRVYDCAVYLTSSVQYVSILP